MTRTFLDTFFTSFPPLHALSVFGRPRSGHQFSSLLPYFSLSLQMSFSWPLPLSIWVLRRQSNRFLSLGAQKDRIIT
jgi:hypothetical protein